MDLVLFTNGNKSIFASSEGGSFVLDSAIIFQDPDLFIGRFLYQMQRLFNIQDYSSINNVIISITGMIDAEKKTILKANLLNDISRTKVYNGFNFEVALSGILPKDNLFLANDAFSTSLGISKTEEHLDLPCLVVMLGDGIGVSFIEKSGSIISEEWGGDYVPNIKKDMYTALGRESMYSLLLTGIVDLNKRYTEYLVESVKYLISKYERDNEKLLSVAILGEKTRLVDFELLKSGLSDYSLIYVDDTSKRQEIIVKGCFEYPEYLTSQKNKIVKIQYFTEQELIYDFDNFQKCKEHFISASPITNSNNYYKMIYSNGSVKTISIGSLKDLSELDIYRF